MRPIIIIFIIIIIVGNCTIQAQNATRLIRIHSGVFGPRQKKMVEIDDEGWAGPDFQFCLVYVDVWGIFFTFTSHFWIWMGELIPKY